MTGQLLRTALSYSTLILGLLIVGACNDDDSPGSGGGSGGNPQGPGATPERQLLSNAAGCDPCVWSITASGKNDGDMKTPIALHENTLYAARFYNTDLTIFSSTNGLDWQTVVQLRDGRVNDASQPDTDSFVVQSPNHFHFVSRYRNKLTHYEAKYGTLKATVLSEIVTSDVSNVVLSGSTLTVYCVEESDGLSPVWASYAGEVWQKSPPHHDRIQTRPLGRSQWQASGLPFGEHQTGEPQNSCLARRNQLGR